MGEGYFCITKQVATEFEGTSQGGVVIRWGVERRLHQHTGDKFRLLRLFKEGNVVLAYSFLYHVRDMEPRVVTVVREYPIADTTRFTLTPDEVSEAQSFMESVSLPLPQVHLQLAFESFEFSYEIHDISLAFLSLMIAMEVLLQKSNHELRYRVSRNTGVLLGQDRSRGEAIFMEMRDLYDKRSKLVHMGDRSSVTREDVLKLRHYVRETIKEVVSSGMSKDELARTLNSCGFGQRPWRQNAT